MRDRLTLNDPERLLTIAAAAQRLDISPPTLRKLVRLGKLHPIRRGKRWVRFRVQDIEAYIRTRQRQAEAKARGDDLPRWP